MKFFTISGVLSPLLHRLLVLGVDVLDILPHQALGVLEVLATLPQYVGRVEGSHRLEAAVDLVPLAAVLCDPEVLVYDRLGGRSSEAEDDTRPHRLYLALQVRVAGPVLTGPLPDQHQRRVRISAPENRVRPAQRKVALGADRDLAGELSESLLPALAAFRGVKETIHSSPPWSCSDLSTSCYSTPVSPALGR